MALDKRSIKAIREFIGVIPEHIENCAAACAFDLLSGPSFVVIPDGNIVNFDGETYVLYSDAEDKAEEGDEIEEVYTGQVGAALRGFIADLPSELWVNTCCDYVTDITSNDTEECYACNGTGEIPTPESDAEDFDDDCGEGVCEICDGEGYLESDLSEWYHLDTREIVELLFGRTIAREFS